MSEYMWGIRYEKPTRAEAKRMDKVCREEGGHGYVEINVNSGSHPGVNNGRYQGWFSGPNKGNPFDQDLARRVDDRLSGAHR